MLAFFYTLMTAMIPDNHLEVKPKNQVSNVFCLCKLISYNVVPENANQNRDVRKFMKTMKPTFLIILIIDIDFSSVLGTQPLHRE